MDNLERALALQGASGPSVRESIRTSLPTVDGDLDALLVTAVLILGGRYSGRDAYAIEVRRSGHPQALAADLAPEATLAGRLTEVSALLAAPAETTGTRLVLGADLDGGTALGDLELIFSATATETGLILSATGRSYQDDPGWATRSLGHLAQIVQALHGSPHLSVGELEILTPAERDRILHDFNRPMEGYPRDATITGLFAAQAAAAPEQIALVKGDETLTYAELDDRSEALANALRRHGVQPGDHVALLADKVPQMVVATLAILKCGAAYVPVDPGYPTERRDFLLRDCGASVLVTAGVTAPTGLDGITVVDAGEGRDAGEAPAPAAAATDIAYVIYTSGSTGNPKGVSVPHRGVVRLAAACDYIALSPQTRLLQTCPIIFDVTTWELWGPLLNGGTVALVPNETLLDAAALGEAIRRHRITTMWLTAPLLHLLVDQDPAIFAPLDEVIAGGDVLSAPHLARLMAACPDLRVVNGYGPTENTTFSTAHHIAAPPNGRVPIGRPIPGSTAYVLDERGRPQPVGIPGELYVGGDGVAEGYRNRPDLTGRAFSDDPFPPYGRRYRTGDLARWLPNGAVDFLGRVDNQVKIRGFRIETSEVEQHLNRVPGIRQSAVTVRERQGEKFLCAHYTAEPGLTGERIRAELGRTLPHYMIPSVLVPLESMPFGHSGKIDRGALATLALPEAESTEPEGDDLERAVAAMWGEALGLERIGLDEDLFGLGVSSLTTAVVAGRLQREQGVQVPAAKLLAHPTVRGVAALVRDAAEGDALGLPPIGPAPDRAVYPVSAQQRRVIVEQFKDEHATHYNLPVQITLPERPDPARLNAALGKLLERHESLRTGFIQMGSDYYQRVHDDVAIEVQVVDDIESWRPRPFDLARPPLVRAACSAPGGPHTVILDFHHSVVDGHSLGLLLDDLDRLCRGETPPVAPLRYRDYSAWQHGEGGEAVRRTQEDFWLRTFAAPLEPLRLPTDHPRGPVREFDGARFDFAFGTARTEGLRELGRRCGATLFHTLTAAYLVFLHRITGQSDLTVGLPVDGRGVGDLGQVAGMFANTLCLRSEVDSGRGFAEYLRAVSGHVIEAFSHQDYQFDELASKVQAERDYSRNPLFDTMFAYSETEPAGRPCLGGLARQDDSASAASMFDLNLQVAGTRDLSATWAFNTRLFQERTAKSFADALLETVDDVLADPEAPLGAAPVPDTEVAADHRGIFDF
jgi:amino acid adenylation domain-containing protein